MSEKEIDEALRGRMLTVEEVCHRLSCGVKSVRRLRRLGDQTKGEEGIYPTVLLRDRAVRIPEAAVIKFLRRRVVHAR